MPEQVNNEAVQVLRAFTESFLDTAASIAERLHALTAQAQQMAEAHQDLVAVERWGDEGGYCP